jgi:Fur family transcriptional regulator, ferric uptake regulator
MNPRVKKQIDDLLKSVKLKRTAPRITILNILLNTDKPRTAEEIIEAINKNGPNKVTVYRTLESMVESGLVHKAFIHKRAEYYELANHCTNNQCHPHFVCTNCGKTHCLTEMLIPFAKSPYKGFIIKRQQVQLEGLCPTCA